MILELPSDLQIQVEQLARQRGTDAQTIVIEATREVVGATVGTNGNETHNSETREERRARINKAIDDAQADSAPINRVFGDPVSALMACKRADIEREEERGL